MAVTIGVHAVAEALKAGRPLSRVSIAKGISGGRVQEIVDLCREADVPVRFEPRDILDRLAGTSVHQGVVAVGAAHGYAGLEVVEGAELVVVLDGVEDPHNLGAIVRTAHAAGATAIVIPERRAVGLTETVAKAAAGALEHMKVARVANISQALEALKKKGFWIYGLDERGTEDYDTVEYTLPTVIVMGGEGKGVHQLVRRHCDFLIRIPMSGKISSLNVSVATGIVLFEWKRRRRAV
ncbi:MAG TPA: 23S rRNA (guanosine(2251)-2'-O)-methyltransferase RlmB [Bryobacteraceae bacterium]|nr:23S rRNA (guanosine(2251)-2'-O)-methyltransferase RlmB [Bryobacteraceae bacterium]